MSAAARARSQQRRRSGSASSTYIPVNESTRPPESNRQASLGSPTSSANSYSSLPPPQQQHQPQQFQRNTSQAQLVEHRHHHVVQKAKKKKTSGGQLILVGIALAVFTFVGFIVYRWLKARSDAAAQDEIDKLNPGQKTSSVSTRPGEQDDSATTTNAKSMPDQFTQNASNWNGLSTFGDVLNDELARQKGMSSTSSSSLEGNLGSLSPYQVAVEKAKTVASVTLLPRLTRDQENLLIDQLKIPLKDADAFAVFDSQDMPTDGNNNNNNGLLSTEQFEFIAKKFALTNSTGNVPSFGNAAGNLSLNINVGGLTDNNNVVKSALNTFTRALEKVNEDDSLSWTQKVNGQRREFIPPAPYSIHEWPEDRELFPQDYAHKIYAFDEATRISNPTLYNNSSVYFYSPIGDVLKWDDTSKAYKFVPEFSRQPTPNAGNITVLNDWNSGDGDRSADETHSSIPPKEITKFSSVWKWASTQPLPPQGGVKLDNLDVIPLDDKIGGGYLVWTKIASPNSYIWVPYRSSDTGNGWDTDAFLTVMNNLRQNPPKNDPLLLQYGAAVSKFQIFLSKMKFIRFQMGGVRKERTGLNGVVFDLHAKQRKKPVYKVSTAIPPSQDPALMTEKQKKWITDHCGSLDWQYMPPSKAKIASGESGPPTRGQLNGLCLKNCPPGAILKVWRPPTYTEAVYEYGCQYNCPDGTQSSNGFCKRRIENPTFFYTSTTGAANSEDYWSMDQFFCSHSTSDRFWGGRCDDNSIASVDFTDYGVDYDYGPRRMASKDVHNCPVHDGWMRPLEITFKKTPDGKRCYRCSRNDMYLVGNAVDGYMCADPCPPGSTDENTGSTYECVTKWEPLKAPANVRRAAMTQEDIDALEAAEEIARLDRDKNIPAPPPPPPSNPVKTPDEPKSSPTPPGPSGGSKQ